MNAPILNTVPASIAPSPFRPPAPEPHPRPRNWLQLLIALRRNPLTIWNTSHFEEWSLPRGGVSGFGVFLANPAAIRHVLVNNAANYQKDDMQLRLLSLTQGKSLFTAEGEAWKRARRIVAPLFTPKRMATLAEAMKPPIDAHVARLQQSQTGEVLDMSHEMMTLAFDILANTLFSNIIPCGAPAFGAALARYFAVQGVIDPLDLINAPSWIPRIGRIRAKSSIDFFERTMSEMMKTRSDQMARGEAIPPDLLSALIAARDPENDNKLSELEVGANIIASMGAGHETTATTLTWSLYLLSHAPHILEEIEREADAAGDDLVAAALDGQRLAMTRAVFEEAMRLYPTAALITRNAKQADNAAGTDIAKGALVLISPYVIHRHKKLWYQPSSFVPERFLPGQREGIDRFAYLPFGAGPRTCIGAQFAMLKGTMALSALTRRLRFSYAGTSEPELLQRIILKPKAGILMTVRAR